MSICMCSIVPEKSTCKQYRSCYRFRKQPHEFWQPWANLYEPHPADPSIKCLNFIAIEGRKDIKEI